MQILFFALSVRPIALFSVFMMNFLGDGSNAVFHWVGLRHLPQHKAGMLDRVVMETIFANLYNNKETFSMF